MLELCQKLANELVQDLSTVPWGGNIKRGLTTMTEPKRTPTGGWMIGIGSLDILHRDKAPEGTISAFLEWYRGRIEEQKKQQAKVAATARGVEAKKAAEVQAAMKVYRRSTFEQLKISRARAAGTLTKEMIRREEELYTQWIEMEKRLSKLMSAEEYKRYTARYEKIIAREQERWRRKYRRR